MSTAPVTKPDVAATPATPAAAPVSTAQEMKIKASTPAKEAPRSIVQGHANGHANGQANGVHHVNSGSETRRAVNEVTSISEPYCPDPYLANITRDYETKVRIIQKYPEMRKVEKTFFVKQLVHEDRVTKVNKSRIIVVDVEDWVKVPVIKEVTKPKKIKIHKIHEEVRTQTYEEPVIEYERRCTTKRIPRVQLVDLEEEIKVPLIKEVPTVVKIQVPTGGFCESPIDEYYTPGDFNLLSKGGRHHGDHHKHIDDEFIKDKGAPGVGYEGRDGPSPIDGKPGDEYGSHKPLIPSKAKHDYEGPHHEPQVEAIPKPHGEPIGYPSKGLEADDKPHEPVPEPHEPVPKPQELVPKPQEPVLMPRKGTSYPQPL